MLKTQAPPKLDSTQKRYKGSLAGTLVRTLLIFTFLPFAIMAGAAYFRARALLREQSIAQYQNLLTTQLGVITSEVENREALLQRLSESGDFRILMELGLHANPLRPLEFEQIRGGLLKEFDALNGQGDAPAFNRFFIMDTKGNIKIASDSAWQGKTINADFLEHISTERPSISLYGLMPLYENQFILVTAYPYQTTRGSTLGALVAVTEGKNLAKLTQPLNGLRPLASVYYVLPGNQTVVKDPNTDSFLSVQNPEFANKAIAESLAKQIERGSARPTALDFIGSQGAVLAQAQWFSAIQAGVVLEAPNADIYRQITSLAPFTGAIVLGTLAFMVVILYLGVNRVIKPLRALSEITQKFAKGNWEQRAEVTSQDEVGLLAESFNLMAEQLRGTYRSLERKVDERTRQFETAAEIANSFTTLSNLDEMLHTVVEALARQFGYYQTSIFLVDSAGQYLEFKVGYGAATDGLMGKDYRLGVGSNSIMGWVSANNQPRIASDVQEDPLHLKNELLPETRSEATLPISIGSLVLGVLDAQSTEEDTFSPESITMLQALASQLASAIQKIGLEEMSELDFEEMARLYRSSRMVAEATTEEQALSIASEILRESPYVVALLRVEKNGLTTLSTSDESKQGAALPGAPEHTPAADMGEIEKYLSRGALIDTPKVGRSPASLRQIAAAMQIESAAYLPVRKNGKLNVILVMGKREGKLESAALQPYTGFADLVTVSLDKTDALLQIKRHLREVESLASINEAISRSSSMQDFFVTLHQKVREIIGDYSLIVALYDAKTDTISVPFSYEDGNTQSIESFPLGEGLTSILIHSGKPLMLTQDTERRAAELGAKIIGKPARSWMGAPMLVQNAPIGAIIIQDAEHERAFNEDDLKFFTTITNQVAGVIHNVHLLEESQRKAVQLETAAEIARDISSSLNIDDLLIKAVNLIRQRFNFYHASIFLNDLSGEFAVIREATGEAGAQMKRAGYKIGVGSKSTIGFVCSHGEALVINDTSRDATYSTNSLFPETRAEAAIPLKVGERILGALDAQSAQSYAFSEENLRSLQILADQIAIAVVNTELYAETQEHLSQHRLLHHITTKVASGTTLDEALEGAVGGLQVTLGGDRVIILLANREKRVLEIKAATGYAEDITKMEVPLDSGIIGWAATHRSPIRIGDTSLDPRYMKISANTRSELAVPLVYRNELLGVINAESEQVDAYTENDEEMLGTLGGSLAAIIANARLLEQIRQQAERERLVYDITTKIRRSTDMQSIMMTTASELTHIVGARYARLHIKPGKE